MDLNELEPKIVWNLFNQISKIPRQSKKEDKIREWVKNWAILNNIQFKEDKIGNLLLSQKASIGCEKYPGITLQAHLDMVAQKVTISNHNFDTDPIPVLVKTDYVTADGTTLGADNGIGMALALAALVDDSFKHGSIEVILTVDEETGLTGAFGLEKGFFKYKYLLNLDSEEEGEITISAAGGGDTKFVLPVTYSTKPSHQGYKIEISGLQGGHSGIDINKPRLNAIKLIFEGLMNIRCDTDLWLHDIFGGNAHNAIPRKATAEFLIPKSRKFEAMKGFQKWEKVIESYREKEASISVEIKELPLNKGIDQTNKILSLIDEIPHGPMTMSKDIPGLVETSNNLAIIKKNKNTIIIDSNTRSSITQSLKQVHSDLKTLGEKYSAEISHNSIFPGWKPSLDSPFLKLVTEEYEVLLKKKIKLKAIHAGLECGLFVGIDPDLQIVSIGPTIENAHSPQERVYINSVDHIWQLIKQILSKMDRLI